MAGPTRIDLDEGVHLLARSRDAGMEVNWNALGNEARDLQRRDGRVEVGLNAVAIQSKADRRGAGRAATPCGHRAARRCR